MPTCVLRYCKSRSGRCPESNWSFFSFPSVGNKTRKEWIRFVQKERREENWLPSSASKLCSKHFRNKDIKVGKTGRACLKKGSLPCEDKKPKAATSESDEESDSKSAY
ncbi:peroxynitrite isomerase THAP4-like isoform X2 [Pararge aegeria]|uniref:peroxynitrite isomerase THAP4-like isoform X2 n=1 Tax=Pararge aegeria TaxID=116150 RepID=UPI0019D28F1C|nr:peroxynitrite isomerase THAP4-like isoform X2 [Pararge aegeria]